MVTDYGRSTSFDEDAEVDCKWVGEQDDKIKKKYCETSLIYTCPFTCGLCRTDAPTASPTTPNPTASPTTPNPTVPFTAEPTSNPTESKADEMIMFFSADIYSPEELDTADSDSILTKLNEQFDVTSDAYKSSNKKDALMKHGIKQISFTSLKVNDDIPSPGTSGKCEY